MATSLRPGSPRPEILVGALSDQVVDPLAQPFTSRIGLPALLAPGRLVYALPLNDTGPVTIRGTRTLVDTGSALVSDPDGSLVGWSAKVVVHRLVQAGSTPVSRRF